MEKIKHVLFRSWYSLGTLEDRIYHIILDVAVFTSVISVIVGLLQGQPRPAVISTLLVLAYVIVLQYITMRHPKYSNACRILLVLGINLVFYPIEFFRSGGIHSGMILFYLVGLALCALLFKGKKGTVLFLFLLAVLEASVLISAYLPQYVQPMTDKQHLTDVMSSLLLASVTLYAIIALIMLSNNQERKVNEELVEKLRELSVMDALSGLYNRRELFLRLEAMYRNESQQRGETPTRAEYYIAMFDVDGFKKLNDTYGHGFGDTVLVSISRKLKDMVDPGKGELSARYGGEEFVSVLSAHSLEEAFERVDLARKQILELRWEENPSVTISISGGLIACQDHPDLTQAMHDVDELLYKAKTEGKNKIVCADN